MSPNTLNPPKAQFKLWEKLELTKYRHVEGLMLAEGFKVVQELLKSPWETRALLVMEEKQERWGAFLSGVPENQKIYLLSARQWSKLSQDKEPEGIMALTAIPRPANISWLSPPGEGYLLLLHQIRNPNNLGAMMRTALWFGIKTVILSAGSVDFTNPRVVRSSMGSIFHLNIIPEVDFAKVLPRIKKRYTLIGSHARKGIPPHPCPPGTALLLGSESHGLSEQIVDMIDEQWCIPGMGDAESLSLPQAGAIIMYECRRGGNKF